MYIRSISLPLGLHTLGSPQQSGRGGVGRNGGGMGGLTGG